jgi:hypothetical protein
MNSRDVLSLLSSLSGVPEIIDVTQVVGQMLRVRLLSTLHLPSRIFTPKYRRVRFAASSGQRIEKGSTPSRRSRRTYTRL